MPGLREALELNRSVLLLEEMNDDVAMRADDKFEQDPEDTKLMAFGSEETLTRPEPVS